MKTFKAISAQDKTYLRKLSWENVVELFNKKNYMSYKSIIKSQIRFLNLNNIDGKNRFKTIIVLENYFKNPNKHLAEQIFWNTIKKKIN